MSLVVIKKSALVTSIGVTINKHVRHRIDMRSQQARLSYEGLLRLCKDVVGREIKNIAKLRVSETNSILEAIEKVERERIMEKCKVKE